MLLSRPAGYAIDAVLQLAQSAGDVPVSSSQLAAAGNMPSRYLLAILRKLVKRGILRSRRGAEGGYLLARKPGEISLLALIEAVDGPLNEVWARPETHGRDNGATRRTAIRDVGWSFGNGLLSLSDGFAGGNGHGGGTATLAAVDETAGRHSASTRGSPPATGRRRASETAFLKLTRSAREFFDAITVAGLLGASPSSPTRLAPGTLPIGVGMSDLAVRDWVI